MAICPNEQASRPTASGHGHIRRRIGWRRTFLPASTRSAARRHSIGAGITGLKMSAGLWLAGRDGGMNGEMAENRQSPGLPPSSYHVQ